MDAELGALASLIELARPVLVPLVREAVRAELSERAAADPDPVVPVVGAIPGSKRKVNAIASKIEGATKVGRVWVARRSAIARFLEAQAPRTRTVAPRASEPWSPELARQRAGIRASGGAR